MYRYSRLLLMLTVILCCGAYVWVHESLKPRLIINVQSDGPIYELTRIVQQQREELEYLSKHPKVIFRCLDDEPKIKYPRHASDDLTEIVMATNDECGNVTADAVMIVHTAANHFQRRERFRNAYADYNKTKPFRLKVVFLVGLAVDANIQIELEKENRQYGDTVMGGFIDTYQNLTLKAVMGYRWLTNTCPDAKLVIKMDDDVFFDTRKFFTRYWQKIGTSRKTRSIHCLVWYNAHVGRAGKWKVERGLFANASYPFPYCAGFFALVTADLIEAMYEYGKSTDFFWIDDVFQYGMVPAAIKNVHFYQIGRKTKAITSNYGSYQGCREKEGVEKCQYWASLTDGEKQFDVEMDHLLHPRPPNITLPAGFKHVNITNLGERVLEKESKVYPEMPEKDSNDNRLPEQLPQKESNVVPDVLQKDSKLAPVVPQKESNIAPAVLPKESNVAPAMPQKESKLAPEVPQKESRFDDQAPQKAAVLKQQSHR